MSSLCFSSGLFCPVPLCLLMKERRKGVIGGGGREVGGGETVNRIYCINKLFSIKNEKLKENELRVLKNRKKLTKKYHVNVHHPY